MLHTRLQTARVLRNFLERDVLRHGPHSEDRGNQLPRGLFVGSRNWISQWPARTILDDAEAVGEVLVTLVGVRSWGPIVLLLRPSEA